MLPSGALDVRGALALSYISLFSLHSMATFADLSSSRAAAAALLSAVGLAPVSKHPSYPRERLALLTTGLSQGNARLTSDDPRAAVLLAQLAEPSGDVPTGHTPPLVRAAWHGCAEHGVEGDVGRLELSRGDEAGTKLLAVFECGARGEPPRFLNRWSAQSVLARQRGVH